MKEVGISFLLLISVCLTFRAAPLTDQLKESAADRSEVEEVDMVKLTVPPAVGTPSNCMGPLLLTPAMDSELW